MRKIKDKTIPIKIDTSFSLFRILERVIVIGIIIFLWNMYSNKQIELQEQKNLVEAATDSLKTWKDKDGKNMAKISVLETTNTKTLLEFESTNKTINELKSLVKTNRSLLKKQGSASIIKSETVIDTTASTIVKIDSITKSPIYESAVKNEWYSIKSRATKDSTNYKLSTFSNLNLTIGREKQGLFKKDKPFAIANDDNPYTNIKDMRTYQVTLPKPKRIGLGVYGGYGATLTNQEVRTGWQIGIGLTYDLIQF